MGHITNKKREDAVCPNCRHPEYRLLHPAYNGGSVQFQCTSCGTKWSYGRKGGKYRKYAIKEGGK